MRNVTRMRRAWMLFVSMFLLAAFGYAQQTVLLTESFESGSGTTPPAGWALEQVTGTTLGVSFVSTSTNPTISAAYDGTLFARYNSYGISSGSTRMKRTTSVSTTNNAFIMVDFAWYEDPGYSTSADKVDVQWSTNGTTWNTAGTFNRYNAVAGWKSKTVVLPSGANGQANLYVAFLFTSAYGNNCALDKVRVTGGPLPPPAFATIGTGTTTVGWPYYTFYMGSRTQMLYTAAQLTAAGATAGNLTSVGFNVASNVTQTMTNFTIKMGATTATTLTSFVSGLSTNYAVNYSVPGTGWRDITLTTPFAWNGTSNVIVEVCFGDNGTYTSNSTVYGTAATGTTWHYHTDNYAGCTGTAAGAVQTTTPNIRFGVPPISPGVLMGYVRDINTLAPIAGAIVTVGSKKDTSRANGMYIIYNLNAGAVTAATTAAGYINNTTNATITTGAVTNQDILMAPGPKVGGMVTDASTGLPLTGAKVTVGTGTDAISTYTIAGGTYLTPLLSIQGAQPIVIGKTGYDNFTGTVTLVPNTTATQDAALLPTAVQPGPFTAVLNNPTNPTAVNLNWGIPQGQYQMIYDDGTQENFAIWANANNLNALKFTPLAWPVKLLGGKVNLGTAANYPSNALPLAKFIMLAYKADGAGGLPGTILDSVEVTPTGFGWNDYTFANPINITAGDFYLVMKQGGIPPHAAGVGVDLTNTQLRSYSKFVTGGAPWIPAAGNFMMRAILQGTGGPILGDNATGERKLITAGMPEGLIYESPVPTVTGYEGNGDFAPLAMSYQVWRLLQGQEGNQAVWTSIWTGTTNTTVDNGWPTLPNGPYRWAVKAIYSPPGQRPSAPTFSNVIGKGWIANVNVCVALTCAANPKAGTLVKLTNVDYPDTNYTKTSDTSGCVHFTNVWKGNYTLTVTRFTYPVYSQNVTIMGDASYNVTLLQEAAPPSNLVVNDQSLHATWSPPRSVVYQLNEDFSGGLTPNGWVISGGSNWQLSSTVGQPAPSAFFNYSPNVTNYNQYLTSKSLAGLHAPQQKLKYDIFLDNYGNTTLETMAVELWNGTSWSVLKTYDNSTGNNIPWTSETIDITSQTHNPAFKIRFHAAGANSNYIDGWYIDNVKVLSTDGTSGPNPCVIGYNFYLNNVLSAFTTDTTYNIPPNQVVYGQQYQACVKAVYGSGYSTPICVNFTSHFLYPARDLEATPIECTAFLTWKKPATMADGPEIVSITPRTIDPNSAVDASPFEIITKAPASQDNTDALWDVLFAWNVTPASGAGAGQVGVETKDGFLYTSVWGGTNTGPPWFSKYQMATGVLVEAFDVPGATAIRDLAFDGTYFYGGAASTTIYKMDFTNKTLVGTIPVGVSVRHIAFDPVNNGFWCGDWSTMALVNSTTGATIATGPTQANAYGSAYDPDAAGPYLWVHTQTGTPGDQLEQNKITGTTLTPTGVVHNIGTVPGFPSGGIAGGLCGANVGTKWALICNVQGSPNFICALEVHAATGGGTGGTPAGLIGYNIYRGGSFIHYNPHPDSITYYDYNLDPGTYKYEVKAKYDLTSYGFPGQTAESLGNTAGEQTVTLDCGAPIPFYEPWDLGVFTYQNWTHAGHWSINTGIGNPAPCADFTWQPVTTNYSHALTSEVITASAWTCAKIWLDFDLKLVDYNNTGKEKLTLDLFYGGQWHQKLEVTNNGSTGWVHKHIDITAVAGKAFRLRFVANGENSADILHWYVDNVHAYGICTPPKSLTKTQSHFTTTLTWQAPTCITVVPTQLVKLFQWSGTPDNGYYQNYNYGYGVVYDLTTYPDASLNKIDFHHASWGTTGIWQYKIHVVDWNTYTELATLGPLTTTGDDKWENNVTLGNVAGVGGKMIGIMLEPMSNSATDAYPCFSADNVGPDGVSVFGALPDYASFATSAIGDFLQNLWIEIPAGDQSVLVQPRKVTVNELQNQPRTRVAATNRPATGYLTTNQLSLSDVVNELDSSVIIGYNVYRTAETGLPPYSKLTSSPQTATTYVDTYPSTLVSGTFKYYVTSNFKNSVNNEFLCESSSDTITVTFPAVGMNDLTNGQIAVYPNPANEVVNIKSDYTISSVDVMNFVGQTIYTNSDVDARSAKLNVATYKPGVYFVKVTTKEGIRTVKITVTH